MRCFALTKDLACIQYERLGRRSKTEEEEAAVQQWPRNELDFRAQNLVAAVRVQRKCSISVAYQWWDTTFFLSIKLPHSLSLLNLCHFLSLLLSIRVILSVTLPHSLCLSCFQKTVFCSIWRLLARSQGEKGDKVFRLWAQNLTLIHIPYHCTHCGLSLMYSNKLAKSKDMFL